MSAPSVSLSDHQLETDHYLIASYAFTDGGGDEFSNPYGFGFLPEGYGGNATYGPSGGPAYVVTQYLYLGTTTVAELDGPNDPTTVPSPDDSYLNEGDAFANTTPDHLSVGGLMPVGQTTSALQQFFASGGSFVGINIPLFILDRGRPFGTLLIVYSDNDVSINGDGNAPGACNPGLD